MSFLQGLQMGKYTMFKMCSQPKFRGIKKLLRKISIWRIKMVECELNKECPECGGAMVESDDGEYIYCLDCDYEESR